MTEDSPSPAPKDRSPRISLHRKTPSTGESAKSSTSNPSLSPKPSIRKALLTSPAKKAVGLLNAMSPGRRGSATLPDVPAAAVTQPEKGNAEEANLSPTGDAAKAGAVTPEATRSLESLSMEDTKASRHEQTQKATPTPQPSNLPSVISGGKLAINRPTTRSPPTLPPRSIYEQLKPTPPKHIQDKDEGMVVDPSSSEHAVEPELVAIEDAEPPPPPLIYEVEDNGSGPPPFDSKNPWATTASVEPVDYNMWDDTNSVPLNTFNDENNVDNALGLSDGIHAFQLATRSEDLETHNQLGPGITYVRMLNTGVHSGHQVFCVKPANEQTSSEIPSELVQSALSSIPQSPDNLADSRFPARWMFCLDCAGWFRIISGISTSENFLESFSIRPGVDLKESAIADAQTKIQAIHQAITCGSNDHRRSHHFHEVPKSIPQPPPADFDADVTGISAEKVKETADLSSYHCCYCGLFLAFDPTAPVSAIFSNELLNRLMKRDPALGDQDVPVARFYRSLKFLHSILFNILTAKHRPHIKADAKAFVDKIGMDQIGKELMEQSGFQLVEVEEDEIKRKRWTLSLNDNRAVKTATRAWVELGMRLAGVDNPSRQESLVGTLETLGLSTAIQSGLSSAVRTQSPTGAPGDRRMTFDTLGPNSASRMHPSMPFQMACVEIGCSPLDSADAISHAVINQTICNAKHTPMIMDSFEILAAHVDTSDFFGAEEAEKLQSAFVTLKSSGFPGSADMQAAYSFFHFDESVVRLIESSTDTTEGPSLVLLQARQLLDLPENDEQAAQPVSEEQQKHREDVLRSLESLGNGFGNSEFSKAIALLREEALELPQALKVLEIADASSIAPEFWEIIYKSYVLEVPESVQRDKLKKAFEVIAKRLNPAGLRELVDTGKSAAPALPAGLFNIGNTCYLNSLLQYLYAIRELRRGLQARQREHQASLGASQVVVGGRAVALSELERSRRFVQELVSLFNSLDGSQENAVRPEKELAYLALVTAADEHTKEASSDQPSAGTDVTLVNEEPMDMDHDVSASSSGKSVLGKRSTEERDLPEGGEVQPTTESKEPVDATPVVPDIEGSPLSPRSDTGRPIKPLRNASQNNVQSPSVMDEEPETAMDVSAGVTESALVVDSVSSSEVIPAPPPLPPRQHRPSMTSDMMFGQQHDISECMDNILFQVEAALASEKHASSAEGSNLVKRLFYGKAKQQLLLPAKSADPPSDDLVPQPSVEVVYNNILLSVNEDRGLDLYDKFHDMYFGLDDIEIDGVKGKKSEVLEELPPLLHIQLQRVQFDQETKSAFKSNAYIKFAETVAMDRFLPTADAGKRERSMALAREIASLRATLAELQFSKSGPVADDLDNLREALFSLDPEQEQLYAGLEAESASVKQAVTDAERGIQERRAELDALWSEDRECEYELSSVFMHRGSAGFGHYWLYQRNLPDAPNTYFQFNDETVRMTNAKEVLQDTTGSNANPYLLVYAKKGSNAIEVMTRERKQLLAEMSAAPPAPETAV